MWRILEDKMPREEIEHVAFFLTCREPTTQGKTVVTLLVFACNRKFAANSNLAQLLAFLEMRIEVFEGTDKRTGKMWAEHEPVGAESVPMQQQLLERKILPAFVRALDFDDAKHTLLLLCHADKRTTCVD